MLTTEDEGSSLPIDSVCIFWFINSIPRWKSMYFNSSCSWRWPHGLWVKCGEVESCTICGENITVSCQHVGRYNICFLGIEICSVSMWSGFRIQVSQWVKTFVYYVEPNDESGANVDASVGWMTSQKLLCSQWCNNDCRMTFLLEKLSSCTYHTFLFI
jgi:hypothetical protein